MVKLLALLLASWLAALPAPMPVQVFGLDPSIDPASPTFISGLLDPEDILVHGPSVRTQGSSLGLVDRWALVSSTT